MNKNLTEIVFILDRSGSMGGLEQDTIGGYNSFIEKQQKENGEANLTTVLFDNQYELLHDRIDITKVKTLTENEYFVRGTTALFDALGITIETIGKKLAEIKEQDRPGKVIFVITTDGMENASKQYTQEKIKSLVEHQKEKYAWEFLFLGANIDAVKTATSFGIAKEMAVDFLCDSEGVELFYSEVSKAVSKVRKSEKLDSKWKMQIQADFESRGEN
ncbi:MAG: VWA domain-containing protein [Erysipelotrichales bacterium]|nr:VWA domain-containing protein [Erysipelotrichales bacterium]